MINTLLTLVSTQWKRTVLSALLATVVTMSLPLRAMAAEAIVPELSPVPEQGDASSINSAPAAATEPVDDVVPQVAAQAKTEAVVSDETAAPDANGYRVVRVYKNVPSTAYTSRPEETDDSPFIAADGTHVYDGMVAANFLKFGTKVRIPELYGDKIFEVHDRMNKRYNVKVDIWMASLKAARQHGVRHLTIEIVEEAKTEVAQK